MNEHDATEQAYRNGYSKGREDAAREIFGEMEKFFTTDGHLVFGSFRKYTEIKKKYTGEK